MTTLLATLVLGLTVGLAERCRPTEPKPLGDHVWAIEEAGHTFVDLRATTDERKIAEMISRLDYLVSHENGPHNANYERFKREYLKNDDPRKFDPPAEMGDHITAAAPELERRGLVKVLNYDDFYAEALRRGLTLKIGK